MRRFSASFFRLAASLVAGGCLSLLLASVTATNAMAAGMPQMDFSNSLVLAQAPWLLVIFFILFLTVKGIALPRVENVLVNRRQRIDQDLESARQAKAQADKAVENLIKSRNEAAAEAQANIDNIINQSRAAANKKLREVTARLDQEMQQSENRIAAARNDALKQIDQISKEAAQTLLQQLLGENIDQTILDKKIHQVITAKS